MSWGCWIENFKAMPFVQDAAICGYSGVRNCGHTPQHAAQTQPSVWTSFPNGPLSKITPEQLSHLTRIHEREKILTEGVTVGDFKARVLRDDFVLTEADSSITTVDLKTKALEGSDKSYNIGVAATDKVLVIVLGQEGSQGPRVTIAAMEKAKELRNSGF
uniref:Profilin n=1 Tax=Callorhinchus milii TaxID=7868 RepID=K4G068_CALMI|nr:profilin 2-like protein [Callorhinchus milii]